jgi:RimJ/RimL family protein N-acetyltransferase
MPRLERVTLVGAHVRLEPLTLADAPALHRAASGSRATFAWTLVPDSLAATEAYVAKALGEEERGESLPFVVKDASGEAVGTTRYLGIEHWSWAPHAPLEPVPSGPDALEIGATWYAERVQRTGVNTEAKLLLCAHAFETLGVRRIAWKTDARNARSREAILRLGATFDGILRAHRPGADGVVRDSAYYSMLRGEWGEAKAALQQKLAASRL